MVNSFLWKGRHRHGLTIWRRAVYLELFHWAGSPTIIIDEHFGLALRAMWELESPPYGDKIAREAVSTTIPLPSRERNGPIFHRLQLNFSVTLRMVRLSDYLRDGCSCGIIDSFCHNSRIAVATFCLLQSKVCSCKHRLLLQLFSPHKTCWGGSFAEAK